MNVMKKFASYYKPYRKFLYLDLLCATFISAVDLAFPQILRRAAGTWFTQGSDAIFHTLGFLLAGLLALYLLQTVCKYYVTYQGHVMGTWIERDMRQELFDHYEKLSFSYYDKNNTGQMMSKLVSDLFEISEFAHHGPENVFISSIKIAGSFLFLFLINGKLALLLAVVVAMMVVFCFRQNKRMQETFMDNRRKIGDINARLQDTLSGIRVVQSFANEEIEMDKFKIGNNNFLESKKENYKFMALYHSGLTAFTTLITVIVIAAGAIFITKNLISITDLITFLLYINNFTEPIKKLINFTEQFQNGASGYTRFLEMLSIRPDIQDSPDAVTLKSAKGDIRFEDVSFHYEDHTEMVLSGLNLHVHPGEYIALVGTSGVGKSTLCSLIPRFYEVSGGNITIDGTDIRNFTLKSLRNCIGIVQQDVYLFTGSVMDNIRYGRPDATEAEIVAAAQNANAHEFIMNLPDGYDTYIGQRGVKLSGGQKQRLSIARVFLKNPPILIFDEATSALDNESEKVVQDSLEKLSKNRTTFVIAHRLSTIRNAEKILVLTEHGIAESGTHDQLLSQNGIYAELYNMQFSK